MLLKKLITPLFNHLTAGTNTKSLQSKIALLNSKNLNSIPDYIKESTNNYNDINTVIREYTKLATINNVDFIALKLSSLNFSSTIINQIIKTLINHNKKILIDAENVKNQPLINDITNDLINKYK